MSGPEPIESAWQPLTFKGVASFGDASTTRLLGVQAVFAILVGAVAVWCIDTAWSPTIYRAIRGLPEQGEIRNGRLFWPDPTPRLLAEAEFLAFISDLRHTGTVRAPAHIQVEFGFSSVRFLSLFGYIDVGYPARESAIAFDRPALDPWWGAWRPPLLWIAFFGTCVWLMLTWAMLGAVLAWLAWLIAFFANRRLSARGSWRLASAALMPGALLMSVAILLYGLGMLELLQLLAAFVIHLLVDLVYVIGSPLRRPRLEPARKNKNPFAANR